MRVGSGCSFRSVSFEHENWDGNAQEREDADEGDCWCDFDAFGAHERDENADACDDGEGAEGDKYAPAKGLGTAVRIVCEHRVVPDSNALASKAGTYVGIQSVVVPRPPYRGNDLLTMIQTQESCDGLKMMHGEFGMRVMGMMILDVHRAS